MPPEAIIHIIDDDDAMRDSLCFLLRSAGFEARPYVSAEVFLASSQTDGDGCIVTDIRMPGMNGLDLTRQLQKSGIHLPVVMITGHGDVALAVESMKAGAADFLEKPFDDDDLLQAIRSAMSKTTAPAGADRFSQLIEDLSPREVDVLRGVVGGKANKVIAFELGISPRTVEVYRANVMTKTRAASLADLVRMALVAGFT